MIEVIEELASTSGTLLERLASGAAVPEGHWLVANRQTSGRGRQGRTWFDGRGNFMGSTFVASHAGDPPLGTLALAIGVAVREAVLKHLPAGREVLLKWPNDLLVGGAKLSGILLEGARGGVVVGIGVNLAAARNYPIARQSRSPRLGGIPTVTLLRRIWPWPSIRKWSAGAHLAWSR